jgi:hypothetical protein
MGRQEAVQRRVAMNKNESMEEIEKTPEEIEQILKDQEKVADEINAETTSEKPSSIGKVIGLMDVDRPKQSKEEQIKHDENYAKIKNSLVHLFTRDENSVSYLRDRLSYTFELTLYDHYRQNLNLWGVKASVVPVESLVPSGFDLKIYDDYVKEAKKLPDGYYGIQCEFDIEKA